MKKKTLGLLFLSIFSLSACELNFANLLSVFKKDLHVEQQSEQNEEQPEQKEEQSNQKEESNENHESHIIPSSGSLIQAAKAIAQKIDDIPSINDIVGEDAQNKINPNNIALRSRLLERNTEQTTYDYTTQQTIYNSPSENFVDEGMVNLFTIDYLIEFYKEEIEFVLNNSQKFNEWTPYDSNWDVRMVFIPALKYLRCEERSINRERYSTFTIQLTNEDKVIFTLKQYIGAMYDEYQHSIYFYETHYVEDEYFEVISTREFDGLGREWLRSYTRMDLHEKIIRFYDRFTSGYNTTVYERYGELKFGDAPYLGYVTNDGWFAIFNKKFELSVFLYDAILLYDLEGYQSITCDEEIKINYGVDGDSRQRNLPISITMDDGTVYKNGENGINIYAEAFYNLKDELVVLPYIVAPIRDPYQAIQYITNLGFTFKFDYRSIYEGLLVDYQRFTSDGSIEKYRDLTNARYEHLSMDIIWAKASANNLDPIAKDTDLVYIATECSGHVNASNQKINLNGMQFTIYECENYKQKDAYIDVYLVGREDNYFVGSQKVDYKGESTTYNLNLELDLDGVLPSPANYEIRIMLRSNGHESYQLKGKSINFVDENGYQFYTDSEGNLFIQVNRRSLDN